MKPRVDTVHSAANPTLTRIRRLVGDSALARREGLVWLEGDHLCEAAAGRHWTIPIAVLAQRGWALPARQALTAAAAAARVIVVPDHLFAGLSGLESPADIGFLAELPPLPGADPSLPSVVLDRLQDAGNAGSVLRSAAALGVQQVLATAGTVALWSAKVLRAGMGAHFALRLVEGLSETSLMDLGLSLVVADAHAEHALPLAPLPTAACWVFGNEGRGVDPKLLSVASMRVRIPQPGGQESLNVAAAAAICLYESSCRRLREAPGAGHR